LNTAYNRSDWLKRRRHKFHESLEGEESGYNKPLRDKIESRNGNPEKLSLSNELQNLIQQSLRALPGKLRMAVVLRDIEGINYEDIATILNINIGTVKSRIARGRTAMRNYLKDYIEK
jgi:RNA polymerase sigma-70 factor (ECF subfamily)